MDSDNTQNNPVIEAQEQVPDSTIAVLPESSQPNGSTPTDLPPEAPESPTSDPDPIPVEDQNAGVNTADSGVTEAPKVAENVAPTPQTPIAPQPQSSAQFDQAGFVKSLLIKAQAKIQFNKQKKLEKIMVLAQKKKVITNDDVQKVLYVSDATATRYLVKLVAQGRLARAGNPRDAKYQFVR
jgi:hypothetical protein